ncbi:MAG: hypothetical protein ACRD2P_03940, partial [Terriglobia bacterium]
ADLKVCARRARNLYWAISRHKWQGKRVNDKILRFGCLAASDKGSEARQQKSREPGAAREARHSTQRDAKGAEAGDAVALFSVGRFAHPCFKLARAYSEYPAEFLRIHTEPQKSRGELRCSAGVPDFRR